MPSGDIVPRLILDSFLVSRFISPSEVNILADHFLKWAIGFV